MRSFLLATPTPSIQRLRATTRWIIGFPPVRMVTSPNVTDVLLALTSSGPINPAQGLTLRMLPLWSRQIREGRGLVARWAGIVSPKRADSAFARCSSTLSSQRTSPPYAYGNSSDLGLSEHCRMRSVIPRWDLSMSTSCFVRCFSRVTDGAATTKQALPNPRRCPT